MIILHFWLKTQKMTFFGHILPGSFFVLFGVWWSFATSIRFAQAKLKRKDRPVGYRSTVAMPCVCLPCRPLRRLPTESLVKLVFAFIGIVCETYAGWTLYDVHLSLRLPGVPAGYMQHITMYASFMLGALVEIRLHYGHDLPAGLDYACGAIGFFVEAFVFSSHLHGKSALDSYFHVLLVG
jgi:hypothetical protein